MDETPSATRPQQRASRPVKRWDWKGPGAGRASAATPCPICGGDSNCQVSAEGVVCCRRRLEWTGGSDGPNRVLGIGHAAGTTYQYDRKHGDDGRDWVPVDPTTGELVKAPELTPEQQAAKHSREAERQRVERLAVRRYLKFLITSTEGEAVDFGRAVVESYLAGRGIEPEWLPTGHAPATWMFYRRAPEFWPWQRSEERAAFKAGTGGMPKETDMPARCTAAILAPVVMPWVEGDRQARFAGAHGTCVVQLPSGRWVKRPRSDDRWQPDRIMHACSLPGVVILPVADGEDGDVPRGVLLVGEGIETTHAGQAALNMAGLPALAWAAMDAGNLVKIELPAAWLRDPEKLHTLIVLGDLDKAKGKTGQPSKTGQKKAAKAVLRFRELYPHLTVVARYPNSKWYPKLVQSAPPGEDNAKGLNKGWLGRFWTAVEGVPREDAEELPVDQDGGCDWDDALQTTGDPVHAGRAILDGLNLDTNLERARYELARRKPAGASPGNDPHTPENEAINPAEGDALTPPGASENTGEGGGEPPDFGGLLQWFYEDDDRSRPRRPVVAKDVVTRARLFLVQRAWQQGDQRWRLAYWAGVWYWFGDAGWEEISETQLHHRIAVWLRQLWQVKAKKDGRELERINPGRSTVQDIIIKLAGECEVLVQSLPAWLPPVVDAEGIPYWARGREVPERRANTYHRERGQAGQWFVDQGGMFPLAEVVEIQKGKREAIERRPHVPDLLTTWRRPYTLDLVELAAALRDPGGWTPARSSRLFPLWWQLLRDLTEKVAPELAADRIVQLGMMMGESLSGDRRLEIVNLLSGPTRSGKTTIEGVLVAMHGPPPITAATSFSALGSGFGLMDLVGKPLVVISDGEVGRYTDTGVATEVLKTLSGRGMVRVEPKYGTAVTVMLSCRIWIFVNSDPGKLQDNSGALSGRMCPWPMNRSFFGQEDPGLKERVVEEAPQIAIWAMFWYAQLMAMERPRIPLGELAHEARNQLLGQQSPIWPFVSECLLTDPCVDAPGGLVVRCVDEAHAVPFTETLYRVYKNYCASKEKPAVGEAKLSAQLKMFAPWIRERQLAKHDRKRSLVGMGLRPDLPEELFRVRRFKEEAVTYGPAADDPNVFTAPA
jgi:hypothetical protein